MSSDEAPFDFDVFLSHASEDKDAFVRPLAAALQAAGLRVWYDEWALALGDRLRRKIDEGLKRSRFGVVVLSRSFFAKNWPQQELDGLAALESAGADRILPIWHEVTQQAVANFSPQLADRLAVASDQGIDHVVTEIRRAVERTPNSSPISLPVRRARRRAAVDNHLRARSLVGDEGDAFGHNPDADLLRRTNGDCTVECSAFVALCLVPVEENEELDSAELVRWAARRDWPDFHPLGGRDTRPRLDGVIVRKKVDDSEQLSRYTHISGDGYVEWGRALGGCYKDICVVRLGPLLWAAIELYEFLDEFRAKFDLRSGYEIVVSVGGARGACLSHVGEGWLEPWDDFDRDRPTCMDQVVQYRRPLSATLGQEDRESMILDLDMHLSQVWGVDGAFGHDHPRRSPNGLPALSERYRKRDPWE